MQFLITSLKKSFPDKSRSTQPQMEIVKQKLDPASRVMEYLGGKMDLS